jgi:hypothetical protein
MRVLSEVAGIFNVRSLDHRRCTVWIATKWLSKRADKMSCTRDTVTGAYKMVSYTALAL